ncbi:MAG: hypothetical protein ACI83O_000481 [Patescibacteria group bacterium]|jgi:hypothetical protein
MEQTIELKELQNTLNEMKIDIEFIKDELKQPITQEDLEFSQETREAQQQISQANLKEQTKEEFINEMNSW